MNINEIANRIANLHYPDIPKTRGDKMFRRQRVIELKTLIESELKKCSIPDVGQSLPDAEQCLKIQEQVKQYCYTEQDNTPVISSGGIRAIISRWKKMVR